jgi:magnesium chelatase family protein
MGLAVPHSCALAGMESPPVTVELHLANGPPSFQIVDLPEAEEKESRVRAALQTSRFEFPAKGITVNLAPADLPKESDRFDLPIALGILAASEQIPQDKLKNYEVAGELALTGALRPVRGALAMTCTASRDGRAFILPSPKAHEAALVKNAAIYPAETLLQVCAHLSDREPLHRHQADAVPDTAYYPNLADVKGQRMPKRALEIAAAGSDTVLPAHIVETIQYRRGDMH